MGVTGLWNLVDGVGHPISLETLHNKILAIDLSIWINQSIKGFRDRDGQVLENAHVLGLFHRICKLLFYKIKPVFVFDGGCPQLKRRTTQRRLEQRLKAIDRSREGSLKILENYIASQLSTSVEQLRKNDSLPSLQSSLLDVPKSKSMQIYEELVDLNRFQDLKESSDESESEPNIAHNYTDLQNLDSIDVNSDHFKSLPPDIRYEILTELRQKYKGYRNMEIMPKESNDFSSYQMQRLLKKRGLQHSIEETIKQLNSNSSDDIIRDWNGKEFYIESETNAGRLMSDENTHFVLMKKSQTINSDNSSAIHSERPQLHVNNENNQIFITSVNNSKSLCVEQLNKSLCDEELNESLLQTIGDSSHNQEINNNFVNNSPKGEINNKNFDRIETKKLSIEVIPIPQKPIEISDESDVELKEQNVCPTNKTIEDSIEESEKSCNEFTRIKTVEVISDTSDDDFEEVWPQSPDSIDKLVANIDEKDLQNIISSKTTSREINSEESALNRFEPIVNSFESIEEKADVCDPQEIESEKPELNLPSNEVSEEVSVKSIASSSQSIPISREELRETRREVNKQNRYANQTTDKMMTDCQELLRLFGVPFIISPMEAEAQCAALEELGLTNGTITDDSDVLLFGAQTVYKNFFTSSKYVELYKSSDIESRFGLSRSSMICIAMLCGSDYTDGVDGVGAVKATEILSEFPGEGLQPLINFKNWWTNKKSSKNKKPDNSIRAKLMKLKLNEAFPNQVIFDAYMNPTVDKSEEQFSWGMPLLDDLRRYANDRFGWTSTKTDQILLPVIKKVNEKQTQMTIDNYFKIQIQPKDTATLSKRLNKAIDKLRGVESEPQSSCSRNGTLGVLSQKVKNQRRKRGSKKDLNKEKPFPKRLNVSHSRPQVVNLSESSESD